MERELNRINAALKEVWNSVYFCSVLIRAESRIFDQVTLRLSHSLSRVLSSIPKFAVCFCLTAYLLFLTTFVMAGVPEKINIQGRLTDQKGVNRDGNFVMQFTIYDQPAGGTDKWKKTYPSVQVRNGNFSVNLGQPTGAEAVGVDDTLRKLADAFDGSNRYLAIGVQGEPDLVPRQQLVTVPYAFNAFNGVPIGTILDWYRPTLTTQVPDGFKICDGSVVNDQASPFHNQPVPNLTDRITYGVALGGGAEKLPGGNNDLSLTHSHPVNSHFHSVGQHSHPINIKAIRSDETTFNGSINGGASGFDGVGVPYFMGNLHAVLTQPSFIPFYRAHVNGTSNVSDVFNTSSDSIGIQDALIFSSGNGLNRQAYVGVVKIIRIK